MIPEGSHLVSDSKASLPNPKLGHISASCWSVEYNNPFSLAILKDGKKKIGEKLYAVSPLKDKSIEVEIVSSHYVDPKGERVRSLQLFLLYNLFIKRVISEITTKKMSVIY